MLAWVRRLFSGFKRLNPKAAYLEHQEASQFPWATFEVIGFEDNGRVKVEFNWNAEFIRRIRALGFDAETDEDCVQLFFYASQLRPTELSEGDDPVNSTEHPTLSGQQNVLRT